jgi:hypothetical protein
MNDREMNDLFTAARAWNPVDRRMLDRVAERLESRSRFPFESFVLAATAVAVLLSISTPKVGSIAEDVPRTLPRFAAVKFVARPTIDRRVRAPKAIVVIETPPARAVPIFIEEPPPPAPKYLPRAIVDFQSLDPDDEVRAYVRSIIAGRDPKSQLAEMCQ